jgi:MFS family permease
MRVFTQVASPRRRRQYQFSMVAFSHPLWRFLCLYGALYAGFGVLSPYLPTLLESRNLGPEAIALVLGAGTAIRLIAGPVAGRLADILDAPKAVLAACSVAAALIALGYLQGTGLLLLFVVGVLQSAALAPLAPLPIRSLSPVRLPIHPKVLPSNVSTMAGCVVVAPRRSFAEPCFPVRPSRNSGLRRLFGSVPGCSPRPHLPLASCQF